MSETLQGLRAERDFEEIKGIAQCEQLMGAALVRRHGTVHREH